MGRGRPPLPTEELIRRGTYRADRHAKREDAPLFSAGPEKPKGLNRIAAKYWRDVIQPLVEKNLVAVVDRPALEALANWYAIYHAQMEQLAENPANIGLFNAVNKSWATYSRLAAKFGLTPGDRNAIKNSGGGGEPSKKKTNAVEDFKVSNSAESSVTPAPSVPPDDYQ